YTPLPIPTLSAAGASAGLGPDRVAPGGAGGSDVPTRPSPALSRPIPSRIGEDIGVAAEMERARRMGVQTPLPAPTLSPNGARAGLGPFVTGSSGDKARADAMARD